MITNDFRCLGLLSTNLCSLPDSSRPNCTRPKCALPNWALPMKTYQTELHLTMNCQRALPNPNPGTRPSCVCKCLSSCIFEKQPGRPDPMAACACPPQTCGRPWRAPLQMPRRSPGFPSTRGLANGRLHVPTQYIGPHHPAAVLALDEPAYWTCPPRPAAYRFSQMPQKPPTVALMFAAVSSLPQVTERDANKYKSHKEARLLNHICYKRDLGMSQPCLANHASWSACLVWSVAVLP